MCDNTRIPNPSEEPGAQEKILQLIEREQLTNERDPYFDTISIEDPDGAGAMLFDQFLRNCGSNQRGK